MSDLTDFLLARIAEDEHEHRAWTDGTEGDEPTCYEDSKPYPCRVVSECEAKRAIVAELSDVMAEAGQQAPNVSTEVTYIGAALRTAAAYLAAVYADHPDYREEWKP